MSSATTSRGTGTRGSRLFAGAPSKALRISAWISFLLNTLIIATGGTVRLTGSGLGCPNWPLCAPGSLVPTQELSWHSLIEFGNRTLSGPLLLFAIIVLVLSWMIRDQRRDLFILSVVVFALVALQALLGGIIVWMHLNANLVGVHYTISLIIVCVTAVYLNRMYDTPGPRELVVPKPFMILTHVLTLAMALTVIFGVITTGSGPHSGDDTIQRDGIDAGLMAHIHAWPGYISFALALVLLVWAAIKRLRPLSWLVVLFVLILVQIAVGIYQARSGLPPVAVGVHMVLAALTSAATAIVVMRLKAPAAAEPAAGE